MPLAPGSYSSSIEALNPDGQTSGQAIPTGLPPQYRYSAVPNVPGFSVGTPSVLPAADVMIQIDGDYTNFSSTQTPLIGFGSSDIVVKQALVVSPTELLLNVSVNASAPPTASDVTLTNGLQTTTLPLQMTILAANPNQIGLHAPITNLATTLPGIPVGGTAVINVTGLPASLAANMPGWVLTIGNQPSAPVLVSPGVINATVPGGLTGGAAQVQLTSPTGATTPPIFLKVDAPPPQILTVLNAAGAAISSTQAAHPGDTLTFDVSFGNGDTPITAPNIFVTANAVNGVGGVNVPFTLVNGSTLQIQLPASTPVGTAVPLTVGVGTRVSAPFLLNIN